MEESMSAWTDFLADGVTSFRQGIPGTKGAPLCGYGNRPKILTRSLQPMLHSLIFVAQEFG